MSFLIRIIIIASLIYFFVIPLFVGGYNAITGLFWWMRP